MAFERDAFLPPDQLAKAVLCAAGGERPPAGGAVERLQARLASGEAFVQTLAGARVEADTTQVRFSRELGRRPPGPQSLPLATPAIFDGRFEVVAAEPGCRVAPLAGHAAALPREDRARLRALPAAARPSLPVLLASDGAPRLPAPFGIGPALARSLVADRFAASVGLIADEGALAARSGVAAHGAWPRLVLSSPAGK